MIAHLSIIWLWSTFRYWEGCILKPICDWTTLRTNHHHLLGRVSSKCSIVSNSVIILQSNIRDDRSAWIPNRCKIVKQRIHHCSRKIITEIIRTIQFTICQNIGFIRPGLQHRAHIRVHKEIIGKLIGEVSWQIRPKTSTPPSKIWYCHFKAQSFCIPALIRDNLRPLEMSSLNLCHDSDPDIVE